MSISRVATPMTSPKRARCSNKPAIRTASATLKLPPPSYARRGGEIIAAELGQIGIRVRIEDIEWSQWLDQVFTRHDFDLSIVTHIEPMDYDIYGRPDYYFGYSSPAFDALLTALRGTTDARKRLPLLQAIQRRIADDAVNGFLFEFPRLSVWDARLKGFDPQGPIEANDLSHAYFSGGSAFARQIDQPVSRLWRYLAYAALVVLLGLVFARSGPAYLVRRAFSLALTLLVATIVIFVIIQVVPGDPAVYMMGMHASPGAIALLHKRWASMAPSFHDISAGSGVCSTAISARATPIVFQWRR